MCCEQQQLDCWQPARSCAEAATRVSAFAWTRAARCSGCRQKCVSGNQARVQVELSLTDACPACMHSGSSCQPRASLWHMPAHSSSRQLQLSEEPHNVQPRLSQPSLRPPSRLPGCSQQQPLGLLLQQPHHLHTPAEPLLLGTHGCPCPSSCLPLLILFTHCRLPGCIDCQEPLTGCPTSHTPQLVNQ